MSGGLLNFDSVKKKIDQGQRLLLAGDESVLSRLPTGQWIGGSIPYFMAEEGGLSTRDRVFVTELPQSAESVSIRTYDEQALANVYADAPRNGFSVIILPAGSKAELSFGMHAPSYPSFARRPLVGWVAGVHLEDLGKVAPKVFHGPQGSASGDSAVVMHVTLPDQYVAELGILNIFEQGEGDAITFSSDGFSVEQALVNGVKTNFADYLAAKKVDTRFPLIADYYGASVNVSFQNVDQSKHRVDLYAPVFAGVTYKLAKPVEDYVKQFTSKLSLGLEEIVFSCNCILNYLYSGLEGKRTGSVTGPITFGEVAYQLLNQTMVYLTVHQLAGK